MRSSRRTRAAFVTSSRTRSDGERSRFLEAAELARNAPQLSVGCHVVLIDGEPVLEAEQLRSLTTGTPAARFQGWTQGVRCASDDRTRIDADEITAEAMAQIHKVQSVGIAVSHFDTHKHTRLFQRILRPLLQAAARGRGVRALRNPFGPRLPLRSGRFRRVLILTRYAEVRRVYAGLRRVPRRG